MSDIQNENTEIKYNRANTGSLKVQKTISKVLEQFLG